MTLGCCRGLEYFPEINSLVIVNGKSGAVYVVNMTNGRWTVLKNFRMGALENFGRYNPVHHCVIFGGGNYSPSRNLYRLDTSLQVTPLALAPEPAGMGHSV